MWYFDLYKNNTAVICDDYTEYSYSDIDKEQKDFYGFIQERTLLFILCENTIGSLIGYTSCIINKIVPLMLDSKINEEFLESLILKYKPKYIWLPENAKFNFNGKVILKKHKYKLVEFSEHIESHELFEELGLLLTTSGSTGSQKFVRISYANLIANTKSICEYLEITCKERTITTMPLFYTYGLSLINTYFYKGATILLTSKSVVDNKFWEFFKANKCSSLSGVPFTYEILEKLNFHKMELPSLKVMTQAGGKLNNLTLEYFAKLSKKNEIKFYVMYGQTEATARISYLDYNVVLDKLGSVGKAIPGGKMWLVDKDNNIIDSAFVEGEIVYNGKNVCLGYANGFRDLKNSNENEFILYTNDIGYNDKEGYFYVVRRKDRVIKYNGCRINLDEIENLVNLYIKEKCYVEFNEEENEFHIFTESYNEKLFLKSFLTDKFKINKSKILVKIINKNENKYKSGYSKEGNI